MLHWSARQFGSLAHEGRFGVPSLGHLPLKLGVNLGQPRQGQGLGNGRDQGRNGQPGNDGRHRLDDPREAVDGIPEDGGLQEMADAARINEGTEEPEDARNGTSRRRQTRIASTMGMAV